MYSYQPPRTSLSPYDPHIRLDDERSIDGRDATSLTSTSRPRTTSSLGIATPLRLTSFSQSATSANEVWSFERLAEEFRDNQKKSRRYSDQDVKTRTARAALPMVRKHKSTASYPIYSPSLQHGGFSTAAPFLPWGTSNDMEPPRLIARNNSDASTASGITSRSSFGSRLRNTMSSSSSIDYDSSETSEDSSYSLSGTGDDFLTTINPIPDATALKGGRLVTEPIVPTYARYGAGGEGRQQQNSLPKVGSGPARQLVRKISPSFIPGDGFKKLPKEILMVILAELKRSHLGVGSHTCATCWTRDLVNIGLTCTKWWGAVRGALYEDIQLVGCDSIFHTKKKYKIKHATRLILLRRTLRSRPGLASYVKSLKVPAVPETAKNQAERDVYLDLVASLVMVCPNLERLPGFNQPYNHEFSRLVHALSTRKKLMEKVWIINPSPFQRQRRYPLTEEAKYITPVAAPSPLLPEQCYDFFGYHMNWSCLQTLFLHCNPGGMIDSGLFINIFHSLKPSLENLHVSSFPATSFNDTTLLSLPSLKSLRLENLPGVTTAGLSNYASPSRTDSLTALSLISLPLVSMPVLARLFSHCKSLTRFTISQGSSLSLPIGTDIFLHPYFASPTLQHIHWEFLDPENDKATEILARSIFSGGFPSLRTIRAPTDYEGMLQNLCQPNERIELPGDRYRNLGSPNHSQLPQSQSTTSITSSTGHGHNPYNYNTAKSPSRSTFSLSLGSRSSQSEDYSAREKGMSLAIARRMAQTRLEAATKQPKFHIILWDENGEFVDRIAVGGFIGMIESKISYCLKPDIAGSDEAIANVEGTAGLFDTTEELNVKDGCTGRWNLHSRSQAKKSARGKEEWWHTERGRWRELPLEKFF